MSDFINRSLDEEQMKKLNQDYTVKIEIRKSDLRKQENDLSKLMEEGKEGEDTRRRSMFDHLNVKNSEQRTPG